MHKQNDSILETVQDRDIVRIEVVCDLLNSTIYDDHE